MASSLRDRLWSCPLCAVLLPVAMAIGGCGATREKSTNPVPARFAAPARPVLCPLELAPQRLVPASNSFDARSLIGLTEPAAIERARQHGCAIRVVSRDKRADATIEASQQLNRVDVHVRQRKVAGVEPFDY